MCEPSERAPAYMPLQDLAPEPPNKETSEKKGDFSPPYRFPFLLGYYLAVNAIPDASGIVDGPDCLFFKAEVVHGKHDLNSTLLQVDGQHRILVSHVYTDNLTTEKGDNVRDHLTRLQHMGSKVAFVSSLPMVSIIGTQYDQVIRDLGPSDMDLIEVPGRSLQGDWLDGYSDTLEAMATHLTLAPVDLREGTVAVIGHFMQRTEEDHRGNVREMRRLVESLGLELLTVWLGDEPVSQLAQVAEAQTLLALPMGRKAAELLAKRTGANVVPVDVPMGLGRTSRFLRTLAKATDRRERAEQVIDAELRATLPKLEWLVPHSFLGKRVAFSATPDLIPGFVQLALDLGMEVVHLSCPTRRPSWLGDLAEFGPLPPVFFDVSKRELRGELARLADGEADLLIGSSSVIRNLTERIAAVEFGFPSYTHHVLHDEPNLGYRGFLCFAQRMANAIERRGPYLRIPR